MSGICLFCFACLVIFLFCFCLLLFGWVFVGVFVFFFFLTLENYSTLTSLITYRPRFSLFFVCVSSFLIWLMYFVWGYVHFCFFFLFCFVLFFISFYCFVSLCWVRALSCNDWYLFPSAVVIPEFVGYVMIILLRPVPESIHITQIPNP